MGRAASIFLPILWMASCATMDRSTTTWEDDAREGVASRREEDDAPPQAPAPKRKLLVLRIGENGELADPGEPQRRSPREMELALIQFASKRRMLPSPSKKGSGWTEAQLSTWREALVAIEDGLKARPGQVPRRILMQTRVTFEVELEETVRHHGQTPPEIENRVNGVFARIAHHRREAPAETPQRVRRHALTLEWPVSPVVVTSPFGYRRDPILGFDEIRFHAGLDIGGRKGDIVSASAPGVVVSTGWIGGHGRTVLLEHAGGYYTMYSHLARILVSPGAKLSSGSALGLMGSSGRSTGPHLHFEVRRGGTPIDPLEVIGLTLATNEEATPATGVRLAEHASGDSRLGGAWMP